MTTLGLVIVFCACALSAWQAGRIVALKCDLKRLHQDLKREQVIGELYKKSADVARADRDQRSEWDRNEMLEAQRALTRIREYAATLPPKEMRALLAALRGYEVVNFQQIPWTPPEAG